MLTPDFLANQKELEVETLQGESLAYAKRVPRLGF